MNTEIHPKYEHVKHCRGKVILGIRGPSELSEIKLPAKYLGRVLQLIQQLDRTSKEKKREDEKAQRAREDEERRREHTHKTCMMKERRRKEEEEVRRNEKAHEEDERLFLCQTFKKKMKNKSLVGLGESPRHQKD